MKSAVSLEILEKVRKETGTGGDVDGLALASEIKLFLQFFVTKDVDKKASAFECLNVIHKDYLVEVFPNLSIAWRILLTFPLQLHQVSEVLVASS